MKILVIRFSSIGDIVLCSPVLRGLHVQQNHEVHLLTKEQFAFTSEFNPYIAKTWLLKNDSSELIKSLKKEHFDLIIDLHNNLRSRRFSFALGVPAKRFPKRNIRKWILVKTGISLMPKEHVVDRYMRTVQHLGVLPDSKGLDYFCGNEALKDAHSILKTHQIVQNGFIAAVLGGAHQTKIMPVEQWYSIIEQAPLPVILLGGAADKDRASKIQSKYPEKVIDLCGKTSFNVSAAVLSLSKCVLSHDTGLMHVAAAYGKPIISIWGNTVPEFGMTPFYGAIAPDHYESEVFGLSCRPCSKIGYEHCPKGHFKCMEQQNTKAIALRLKWMCSGG